MSTRDTTNLLTVEAEVEVAAMVVALRNDQHRRGTLLKMFSNGV
jgi:hypothetical protein